MLLYIDACIRGDSSRTEELCQYFLREYAEKNPGDEVVTVDLTWGDYRPMLFKELNHRQQLIEQENWADPMFDDARLFSRADKVLIGAPFWDCSFPSVLKCYIEGICVQNLTFRYVENGAQGLVRVSKMLYVTTAGGKIPETNSGFAYLREVFSTLFGIGSCRHVAAEMLDVEGQDVAARMAGAKRALDELVCTF